MNAIEQAKQEIQSALESIHKVESDLGWSDDSQSALASLVRATASLSSVDAQPVAWTNQQLCDLLPEGVMWGDNLTPELVREILLAASRVPQAAQPVSPAPSDKEAWEIYSRAQQSAGEKKGFALAIAITQAIIAEVRALAAHPAAQPEQAAPGVPEGAIRKKFPATSSEFINKFTLVNGRKPGEQEIFEAGLRFGSDNAGIYAAQRLKAAGLKIVPASPSLATERDAVDAQIGRFLMGLATDNSERSWPRLHKISWSGYAVTNEGDGYRKWTLREALQEDIAAAIAQQESGK